MPKAVADTTPEPNPEEGEVVEEELDSSWLEEPEPMSSMVTPVPIAGQGVTIPVVEQYPFEPSRDESIADKISVTAGWRIEDVAFDVIEGEVPDGIPEATMLMHAGVPVDRAWIAVAAAHQMGYSFRV